LRIILEDLRRNIAQGEESGGSSSPVDDPVEVLNPVELLVSPALKPVEAEVESSLVLTVAVVVVVDPVELEPVVPVLVPSVSPDVADESSPQAITMRESKIQRCFMLSLEPPAANDA